MTSKKPTKGVLLVAEPSIIGDVSFVSTSYVNVFNFSILKPFNSTTMLNLHATLEKTGGGGAVTPQCYLDNFNTSERTVTLSRWLSGTGDIWSSGIPFISDIPLKGNETWRLWCKGTDSNTVEINTTMFLLDMIDSERNVINHFKNRTTGTGTYSGSNNKILSFENYLVKNATEIEFVFAVYYQYI